MSFIVIIPARYASSRLPGKPLLDIAGKPMIHHVYERACESGAERIIIATDDDRIEAVAQSFGAEVCMTSTAHLSGTDRLQEVAAHYDFDQEEIIVNVQGDEPLIPPQNIAQVAHLLGGESETVMATLCEPICDAKVLLNPNVVKVVSDSQDYALYFSRAPIPWARDEFAGGKVLRDGTAEIPKHDYLRHIGIYAYRAGFLHQFVKWPQAPLEKSESLEQLRALWNGERIKIARAIQPPPAGVDTEEDLFRVREILSGTWPNGDA